MQIEGLEVIREDHAESESEIETDQEKDSPEQIFRRLAIVSRSVVVLVLALSAATTAWLAYKLLSKDEESDFSTSFKALANEVIQLATNNGEGIFLGVQSFASLYVPLALATEQTLPFITVKNWEALAADARAICKASTLHYSPLLQTDEELARWNSYSAQNMHWFDDGRAHQHGGVSIEVDDQVMPFSFYFSPTGPAREDMSNGPVSPLWQYGPLSNTSTRIANYNAARNPTFRSVRDITVKTRTAALSTQDFFGGVNSDGDDPPASMLMQPIFSGFDYEPNATVVAHMVAVIPWSEFFSNVLGDDQEVTIVVQSCDSNSTFRVVGPDAIYVGFGDRYEGDFRSLAVTGQFVNSTDYEEELGGCRHKVHVFPSDVMKGEFLTSKPTVYPIVIVAIFLFSGLVFIVYDFFVSNRQSHTERRAEASGAIVQELFPGRVASQLYEDSSPAGYKILGSGMSDGGSVTVAKASIADFYPETTILFADIAGFTAWSSTRDPQQVFMLLETIFQGFDVCAKRLGVFKVETIGDCYVAVCGVPKANHQHAIVMARFAREAMDKFREVVNDLELTLGPDTRDLELRVGLHSGPVTAGVLRGDRARFQLFGDTVNVSSRMESCGQKGRIHLSEETAKEIIKFGKMDWIVRREDQIEAKGKGKMNTFWLTQSGSGAVSSACSSDIEENQEAALVLSDIPTPSENPKIDQGKSAKTESAKLDRLIEWNTDLLLGHLQRAVVRRSELGLKSEPQDVVDRLAQTIARDATARDAVKEVITIPELVYDGSCASVSAADLGPDVKAQLRHFVGHIASMYDTKNSFHNFEHASHVTMSVNKLLSRIVHPDCSAQKFEDKLQEATHVHERSLGLSSDPLTTFSCELAALCHDVGHRGLTNFDLAKEDRSLDERFQGKSIAEQNSVDVTWSILLLPRYSKLRQCIFTTEAELKRFRDLLVNCLIATDIFDKELANIRRTRWNLVFDGVAQSENHGRNQKATIVIEHLIQASDVVHTMQHWHIYRKWNSRLFHEMMAAFQAGRTDRDPSLGWYEGELAFFDKYVIPLAQKLKDCCVFGVSSDEYLNYAVSNRDEWREKGQAIVTEMLGQVAAAHPCDVANTDSTQFSI